MRQFMFSLTVLGFSAWAQPPQQQTQTPIVVQVQIPPEEIWTAIFKIAVPAILAGAVGASITLYGVSLTNRHNRRLNEQNHKYEAEKWQRQEQLQIKKDFYFSLIKSVYDFQARLSNYIGTRLAAKDRPLTDQIRNDLSANKDAVEQLKLALSSAISVGWIILSADSFAQIRKLDACAMTMMTDYASVQDTTPPQSYQHFQTQLLIVVALAKSDLGYG